MIYSHSRLTTFQTCPLKYRYQYLDGLGKEDKEEHLSLTLWKSVHAALEFLYTRISDLDTVSEEQLLHAYQLAREEAGQDLSFPHTVSTPDNSDTDSIALTFYKRGLVYLQRYYATYAPFTRPKPMRVEYRLQFLLQENMQFQGILDRMDIEGDTITIVDYKTNKSLPTNDHDTHRDQLALYGFGIEQKYSWKYTKLLGRLIYLHLEKEVIFEITPEEIATLRAKYIDIITDIESKTTRYMQGRWDEQAFPYHIWSHCDYCPFQQICPARKHQYMQDEQVSIADLWQTTIKRLIDEYGLLSKQISELEKQKNLLKEQLVAYAQDVKLPRIFGDTFKLSLVSRDFLGITDEDSLKEKLLHLNLLEQAIKVDTTKLQKLIDQTEHLATELAWTISRKTTSYFSAPSKIKDHDEPIE